MTGSSEGSGGGNTGFVPMPSATVRRADSPQPHSTQAAARAAMRGSQEALLLRMDLSTDRGLESWSNTRATPPKTRAAVSATQLQTLREPVAWRGAAHGRGVGMSLATLRAIGHLGEFKCG